MSKGGGSSQTTTTQLPQWLQDAAQENLAKARDVSQIGYMPYYGMDVAAFSPMQQQAMQAAGSAASAFGLAPQGFNATAGIPTPQTDNLGFTGYSSGNMYDTSLAEFAARRPAQYAAQAAMFVDPLTGDIPMTYDKGHGFVNSKDISIPTNYGFSSSSGDTQSGGSSPYNPYMNMSLGMEDFLLGRAVQEPWQAGLMGLLTGGPIGAIGSLGFREIAGNMIDNRLDEIDRQQNLYNAVPIGQMVVADENGNLSYAVDPNYTAAQAAASLGGAYSGGSYTPPTTSTGTYGVGGNWSSSSSDGGGYTGGGSSWGGNPSSTISGGSGRTDGGFGW